MWLLLSKNIDSKFSIDKDYTYLVDLKKINIIIGKNNSGKSYFMREILKNTIAILNREELKEIVKSGTNMIHLDYIDTFKQVNCYKEKYEYYKKIINQINIFDESKKESGTTVLNGEYAGKVYTFKNFDEILLNSKELIDYLKLEQISSSEISNKVIHDKTKLLQQIKKEFINFIISTFDNIPDEEVYQFGKVLNDLGYIDSFQKMIKESKMNFKRNYIPITRNIRHPLKQVTGKSEEKLENIYKKRIIDEYGYNEDEVKVITGLDLYDTYKLKLLGNKKERENVEQFEQFLSEYFFEGKSISIIPDEKTYELKINIEDKEDRFIFEVGDGITSLIILIYNLYMEADEKRKIYFIEEPENSFHPGFQRLFMNIISLNSKFKNCYFFFTTHSNHLIDIGSSEFSDFNIFVSKKENETISIKIKNKTDMELLDELGVNASSVQIANKIIWVEGKYDAFYIRLLLDKKNINETGRKYIEDYDYTFVPYGGANGTLINFSIENEEEQNKEFIMKAIKLNNKFILIMDDDGIGNDEKGKSEKIKKYNMLKNKLKNSLYKLQVREIENLFPKEVIKKFFINGIVNPESYDLSFLDNIKYDDYKNKKLGKYYNKLLKDNISDDFKKITNRKEGFENKGFLYSKSKFYECVKEWINNERFNYEKDIPEETKNLINYIEEFIKIK